MGLLDVLNQYQDPSAVPPMNVEEDFKAVAREAHADDLGAGLEQAFRSDDTPPFENMVGQLFQHSGPDQRAGLVNQLVNGLGPSATGMLGGGMLGNIIRRAIENRQPVTPRDVQGVPQSEVESATAEAARNNPSIIQRVSRFYAEHPQVVQMLGQAALSIAMTQMAQRRRM